MMSQYLEALRKPDLTRLLTRRQKSLGGATTKRARLQNSRLNKAETADTVQREVHGAEKPETTKVEK